jgi:hypothetical protein
LCAQVKNLEWSDFLLTFVKHYPREELTPKATVFFEQIFPSAINAQASAPESGWLRAALPLTYRDPAVSRDALYKGLWPSFGVGNYCSGGSLSAHISISLRASHGHCRGAPP